MIAWEAQQELAGAAGELGDLSQLHDLTVKLISSGTFD